MKMSIVYVSLIVLKDTYMYVCIVLRWSEYEDDLVCSALKKSISTSKSKLYNTYLDEFPFLNWFLSLEIIIKRCHLCSLY